MSEFRRQLISSKNTTDRLFAWGDNTYGQLGVGDKETRYHPTTVASHHRFKDIASSSNATFAIDTGGHIHHWGSSVGGVKSSMIPKRISNGVVFVGISSDGTALLAVDSEGITYGLGYNGEYNRLLRGATSVLYEITPITNFKVNKALIIDTGSVFIKSENNKTPLYGIGYNGQGQLGATWTNNVDYVAPIHTGNWVDIVSSYCDQIYAIDVNSNLYASGENNAGALGTITPHLRVGNKVIDHDGNVIDDNSDHVIEGDFLRVALQKLNDKKWKKVSAYRSKVFGIDNDGFLYTWGTISLGSGLSESVTSSLEYSVHPISVGNKRWKSIGVGSGFALGIDINDKLFAWGDNTYGQLGLGSEFVKVYQPTQVNDMEWKKVNVTYRSAFAISK